MLKRSFAEPVSTQTFSESLNLSPEPERDKSFLGNTRSALNLKDASDAEILQAYRQKYPDLSGASDDELAMALETRYNKAGFGERLVKTAGERSLENVSNVFDMGRAPVGDKEKRRREALSGLLPELKGDYKYYGGSDPFYMPEGEGFSAGVAEFLGTVLADLPLMAAAGVGGAGVTAKVGLSGVKGLTAREAIAGSLFAQTRKYDNERERLIGTLEEGALWAGMGVAGHYAGKGLKALAGKLRKGKGAISAGERAEVERELRNVEAAGTSPEKENWAAARAARTTPQEAAGYEWSGPKPGDSPFMRSQVEQKAAEEAQRVADGSHGAAWREFRNKRRQRLLPGGNGPGGNAGEVRTGQPVLHGEEPVDYTPRVVGVDAAGTLPGASGMVGGRYGRNGRRLIGNNGGRPAGARVEFTGGAPELPGRNTGLPVGERAGGTLSALQFRARQAGLSIFDKNGKPYSEAFLRARERARGGVLFNSGKAITTPDAELRGVYEEAARLGIETVNKEGKPFKKTFLQLKINKALKTKRETVKPVDAGGQGGVGGQEIKPKPVDVRETANLRNEDGPFGKNVMQAIRRHYPNDNIEADLLNVESNMQKPQLSAMKTFAGGLLNDIEAIKDGKKITLAEAFVKENIDPQEIWNLTENHAAAIDIGAGYLKDMGYIIKSKPFLNEKIKPVMLEDVGGQGGVGGQKKNKPKEQLNLLKVQAEVPKGKIGKTSEPIEGSQGVGMFKTEPKKVEQEELFGGKKRVLKRSEKTPIIEEKTITGGKEMGISEYKGEAVFNKYSKENLGDSFVENGVKYELTGTVTNKSGVIKSYKYSPALTHEQEILNLKVQGNKETEYLKNKSEFVTRDLIKKINRKFKGKIEGKSDTTASMYSRLNNDIRVRVSDHSPVALRSDADINVWSNDGVVFHVGEDAIVEKGVNESIEDVYNKIIESLDNEIKVKSENLKQVRQERKYIRDLNNLGGGGDLEPPGLMGAKPEIEGAGASPARSEKVQKAAVKYGSKKPKEQLELMKVQAEMPRGKIGKTSEPIEGSQGVGMFKTEPKKVEQEELFGVGKNKKISVMDEETYLSINGADRQDIGDSALHKNLPYGKVRDRILDRQAKKDTELIEKRDRLRKEYREKIDRGELREPTRFEKLVNTAHGMSEKEAVQAARRILEKNGIDWKKSSVGNIVKNSEQAGAKDVTKSESFKKWFGDWEKDPVNASKVVDEQGRPLVVYHTGSMGNVYDMKKSRSYSGSPDYELPGIYTTSNKQESAAYGSKEQIKELYVSIKNPFTGDVNELQQRLGSYRKVMDHLKKNGYDGFIDKELDEYVAFSPEQIKSAIGNRGTFDTGDANILHGKAWPAGAVAGVERDDEGNVTFDAGKAVKGMAAMAVGEAGLKILARNAKNAGRMGIVAEGFAKGEKGKPLSEKVAKAAERYGKKETGPGGQGGVGGQVKPGKPKTRNEIYDEAAKYVGKHGRNTVLRDSWEGTKEQANRLFVPVASRLERINPKLGRKLRRHEFDLGMRITRDVKAVTPFMEVTKKMTPVEKLFLDLARKNGDEEKILELMHRYGGVEQYREYRKVMDDVYKRAKEVGFDLDYRLHYHPRMVKDKRGFLKYFEMSEDWSAIEAAMKEQAAKLQRPLTEDEKVNLVNSLLRGFQKTKIGLPETGSMKERTIEQIDFALNKFYYDSNSSLQMYLNGVNDRIESRRFFGIHGRTAKGKGWMPDAEKTFGVNDAGIEKQEDLKDSIGAYVLDLIKKGEITASDENQVREILQARFHQEGAHGIVALYKNLSYMETMGSFASALTQLGDVAYSLYRTGFYGTAKNIVKSAKTLKDPGAQRISLEDIGVDRIAQEFMAEGNSGKWLDRVFKMTGLTTLDRMGKLTYINAVMDKYMKLARNEKPGGGLKDFVLNKESRAEFMGRLERVFGKDTDKVLADLKAGKVTEDVRYLAFSELLGIQPVALSEMPQNYLSGGNGRIFYMLKTYSLKQWDAYRREALDLMKTDPKRGMRNLMYLSGALLGCNASADMLKNLMLNRDTEPDDLVVDNVARLFGLSKWTIYEARREGAATAAMKMMLPPGKFLDAAYKDASDTYRYFVDDVEVKNYGAKNLNLFGSIPLVGKPYFWWFGKGSEWEKNKSKPRKSGSAKVERARRRYGRRRSR